MDLVIFFGKLVDRYRQADAIINGQAAELERVTVERDNAIQERDKLQALVTALEAQNDAEAEAAKEALEAFEAIELPELTPEEVEGVEANDLENPQQFEDAIIEEAIADDEVELTEEDAPTAGTSEETPVDTVDSAVAAIVDAV